MAWLGHQDNGHCLTWIKRPRADVFDDALIVAAALEAGCDTLYSEDMQHGRKFGGLAIVNPFMEGGG